VRACRADLADAAKANRDAEEKRPLPVMKAAGIKPEQDEEGEAMTMPTVAQMIVWIVVGLIGGGLASRLITWDREGFGNFRNLGLGLVGALIGGLLFRWLNLLPGLDKVSVSLRDIVAAVAGSLLVLAAIWLIRRYAR
jgi:uncharacterized membrane protein YeaQ/YmgE (transglycosylase-associated protein family)